MESFGYALRRFARATDIVNDEVISQVRTHVQEYVDRALDIKHVDIMRQVSVDGKPGLFIVPHSNSAAPNSFSICDPNGTYTCQVAKACDAGIQIWAVAPDGGPLNKAERCTDLWSETNDLPPYWTPQCASEDASEAMTSIVLPLNHGGERIGAVCMDSVRSLEITEAAKEELKLVTEALAILFSTYDAAAYAQSSKQDAIKELRDIIPRDPGLTLPHVFVASSGEAPSDVVNAIVAALERDEFHRTFTSKHWKADPQPGPVSDSVINDIVKARFGICYLSEPDGEEADTQYRDNPNVLFEAGMFQSLRAIGYSAGWVPVREHNAPPPPFNLEDERHIFVPRNDDGSLNQPEFEEELCNFIRKLTE